jgi:tetratricopeptide (TPR) repeat protein
MGKSSNKIKQLKEILKDKPDDLAVLTSLVELYLNSGDSKNALKQVDLFLKTSSDENVQIRFLWGRIYEASKQVELANRYYKQVFDWCEQNKDSRSVDIYGYLGNYWRQKDDARAFHCYYRAYQLGCTDKSILEPLNTIFTVFVELFNQRWFIVHQQNKIFSYSTQQAITFPAMQLSPLDSGLCHDEIAHFLSQSQWGIDLEFFTLPTLLEKAGIAYQNNTALAQLRQKMSCPSDELPINRVAYRAMQCYLDALEMGTQQSLQLFVEDWLKWESDPLSLAFAARLWHKLFHCGWFQDNTTQLSLIFTRYGEVLNSLPKTLGWAKAQLVWQELAFSISSSVEWNAALFQILAVPSIHVALQSTDYFYADRLAVHTDFSYAQQPMTEEQQLLCRNAYVNETRQAGKLVLDTLPKLSLPKNQKPIKIAFVVNLMFNNTSSIQVLSDIQQKIYLINPCPIVAKIYAFYGFEDTISKIQKRLLIEKFKSVGVDIVDLSSCRQKHFNEDNYLERLLFLRELIQKDEVSTVVYIQCSTFFIIFASAVRLAPVQVFFSMAVEGTFRLPELDAYLSLGGTFEHTILSHGHEWRALPGTLGGSAIHSKNPEQDLQQAKRIRAKFPADAVILGTIGRTQKIDSEIFLDIVAEVLHHHPRAIFLWFGKEELPSVKEKMQMRGILDRCLFQGWVDTHEYSRVLDIHLDSYPFGTGVTMFTCMAVGVPAVFFHHSAGEEAVITSVSNIYIEPVLSGSTGTFEQQDSVKAIFTDEDGENLFLNAATPQEYIAHVRRLIEDRVFRRKVGKACQAFVKFMDEINIGEVFTRHIHEIMMECQHESL